MTKQLQDEATLRTLELLTERIGQRLREDRAAYTTSEEVVDALVEAYDKARIALEATDMYALAEALLQCAVVNVIAVVSMVAGSEVTEKSEENTTNPVEDADPKVAVAEEARRLMIERANQSNLVIATEIDSLTGYEGTGGPCTGACGMGNPCTCGHVPYQDMGS